MTRSPGLSCLGVGLGCDFYEPQLLQEMKIIFVGTGALAWGTPYLMGETEYHSRGGGG